MKKRKHNIPIMFWVTEQEHDLIEQRMEQLGTTNMSAYLRKISIDGYVLKLDLPELKEILSPAAVEQQSQSNCQARKRNRAYLRCRYRVLTWKSGTIMVSDK